MVIATGGIVLRYLGYIQRIRTDTQMLANISLIRGECDILGGVILKGKV